MEGNRSGGGLDNDAPGVGGLSTVFWAERLRAGGESVFTVQLRSRDIGNSKPIIRRQAENDDVPASN